MQHGPYQFHALHFHALTVLEINDIGSGHAKLVMYRKKLNHYVVGVAISREVLLYSKVCVKSQQSIYICTLMITFILMSPKER